MPAWTGRESSSIHRVADDAEICRLPGMGPGEAWAWFSPDGQFLALQRSGPRFKVWNLAGPEPVVVVEEMSAPGGSGLQSGQQAACHRTCGRLHPPV